MKISSSFFRSSALIALFLFGIASADAATLLLKLKTTGTLSANERVGGWSATVLLPAYVAAPVSRELDVSSFFASGVTPATFTLAGSYNVPDTNYPVPYLVLASLGDTSNPANGTLTGEVATVMLSLAAGAPQPAKTDFALVDTLISKAAVGSPVAPGLNFDFDLVMSDAKLLSVAIAGNGSVHSADGSIACISGSTTDCSRFFANNTSVTLTPTASSYYTFSGWSGACTNSSGGCIVTLSSDKSVTANFSLLTLPAVRIGGVAPVYMNPATLSNTYLNAPNNAVIEMKSGILAESFTANLGKSVTVRGGFNSDYSANTGSTAISGPLNIQLGSITIDNLTVD
ncbi:MAG: hypothetical protein RW306_17990 [Geobacteraceae bacterium]|nr:hypothetical protein [Geobacteraceae bacterium]